MSIIFNRFVWLLLAILMVGCVKSPDVDESWDSVERYFNEYGIKFSDDLRVDKCALRTSRVDGSRIAFLIAEIEFSSFITFTEQFPKARSAFEIEDNPWEPGGGKYDDIPWWKTNAVGEFKYYFSCGKSPLGQDLVLEASLLKTMDDNNDINGDYMLYLRMMDIYWVTDQESIEDRPVN